MSKRIAVIGIGILVAWPVIAGEAWVPFTDPNINDHGITFLTVGAPGNRIANAEERYPLPEPLNDYPELGRVDYLYRLAQTEVTASQWIEFLYAYDQYWVADGNSRRDVLWTSLLILAGNNNPNLPPSYDIYIDGAEELPVAVGYRVAARYINWLHNGKGADREDFETGVYDTSTFGTDPDSGRFTDDFHRLPGATFWLPTLHEWSKAMHYDPNRYGPGVEGYWNQQGSQDEPLTPGFPGTLGAQTSAALLSGEYEDEFEHISQLSVGGYPHMQSPWGHLDGSGGESEVVATMRYNNLDPDAGLHYGLMWRGSNFRTGETFSLPEDDALGVTFFGAHWLSRYSIRVASVVKTSCAGDVNADAVVNMSDLQQVLARYGATDDAIGDTTGDDRVNFADLNEVLVAFGSECE